MLNGIDLAYSYMRTQYIETICSLNVKLVSSITPRSLTPLTGSSCFPKRERRKLFIYLGSHLSAAKYDKFVLTGLRDGY